MYLEMTEEEDKKMAEGWKADAEGILVFVRLHFLVPYFRPTHESQTGLFSAAVASLISVSIQDIQQNPQDTSNFYLANIYQVLAQSDQLNISISLPTSPPPFSPPTFAVWVNSLWFLSLAISITCALLATLLQQCSRKYLNVRKTRSSLHKRARTRSFFAEGVKKSLLPLAVEALPTLIHVSLSLFFAGLVVFLWNVNLTIFKVVLSWISICTALYGCITFIPIFRHDSPYYSPFTSLVRPVVYVVLMAFMILYFCLYVLLFGFSLLFRCRGLMYAIFGRMPSWFVEVLGVIRMTPEAAVLKSSTEVDTRALMRTFDSLDEDHELERFFSGLPGFQNSKALKQPLDGLNNQQRLRLLEAVIRLLDRTFSSNSLPDQIKRQRADICDNAMKLLDTPNAFPKIIRRLASEDGYGPLQSIKIVDFVRRWGSGIGEYSTLDQTIFSIVVARVQPHDEAWFILASDQLGIQETILRSHAAHGDNLSFSILIYVTRKQFNHFEDPSWPSSTISGVLSAASKFNVQDTSPELQHKFCALWNQIVRRAQNGHKFKIAECILKPIRHVYLRLHHDTNSAPTHFSASTSDSNDNLGDPDMYPVCNVTGHVHDGSALTFPLPVRYNNTASPPAFPTSLGVPFSPVLAPFHFNENLTTPPPPDSSYPTHQVADNFRNPITSPDPAAAGAMRDIVTADIANPHLTREASTSISPLPSASQPADVSLRHDESLLPPSDLPNLPSSASFYTVIDDVPHTSPSLFLHLPMTRSDL